MRVPLIDVNKQNQAVKAEVLESLSRVIDSSAFILGQEVKSFEEEFRSYTGTNHAISCASGTDALLLPLLAAGIEPGDEVLVPAFTFYATAAAPARVGAIPVFVDCDDSYNICVKDLERKITECTKAIIPVHLFGQMADMKKINALVASKNTKAKKIYVIEDAAQSMGAAIEGKQAGLWGDFSAYSFYPTKNLGAMGDAGMMASLTLEDADLLRMLRVHGSKQRYYHELLGVNSRLDSMQAAVLRIKLRYLRAYEKNRSAIADAYTKALKQTKSFQSEKIRLPMMLSGHQHVWNQYTIRTKDRDALRAYLTKAGIGSEIYYPLCMHEQKAFAPFTKGKGSLPVSEKMEQEVLSLPMYPEMPLEHVNIVVSAIEDFYVAQA
jgi:dTDP-4-amino-4,6-dideoxygalactose transaminase